MTKFKNNLFTPLAFTALLLVTGIHADTEDVVGPTITGAALGGIFGGGRGAAIGAGVGLGVGLASSSARDRQRERDYEDDREYYEGEDYSESVSERDKERQRREDRMADRRDRQAELENEGPYPVAPEPSALTQAGRMPAGEEEPYDY